MRPYVQLSSENIGRDLLNALNKSLDKFISLDGVIGIILESYMIQMIKLQTLRIKNFQNLLRYQMQVVYYGNLIGIIN